jgi:regulatory protein
VAESREPDAFDQAVRALRHADRSRAELDARLERQGIPVAEREEALARLERLGYLEDGRVARARAEQLAGRGSGDALIRHDLEQRGIGAETIEEALAALEPERERAARVVAQRGGGARTARYLASRGFAYDAVAEVVAPQE